MPVTACRTGDGAKNAERALSLAFSEASGVSSFSLFIGLGAAGAVTPGLASGDIVASSRVVDESGEVPAPDAVLLARAARLGAKPATFVTTRAPVCSSKEKSDLAARVGASAASPAVADMESAAWARAASGRGLSYLILRAVADTFEEDLPAFLASCLGSDGSVDRAAVARRLILHPSALPGLLGMRERVRDGSARLASFLPRFLSAEA